MILTTGEDDRIIGINNIYDQNGKVDTHAVFETNPQNLPPNLFYVEMWKDHFDGEEFVKQIETITIPESVFEISERTFFRCENLKRIVWPQKINFIREKVFFGCYSLEKIDLPDGLRIIGKEAFMDCYSLEEIVIPESVSLILERAFSNCRNLNKITLPWRLRKPDEAVMGRNAKLDEITWRRNPNHILKGNLLLTKSGDELVQYYPSAEEEFTIPQFILKIRDGAFSGVHLKKLIIPNHVKEIGDMLFSAARIRTVQLPEKLLRAKRSLTFESWIKEIEVIDSSGEIIGLFFVPFESFQFMLYSACSRKLFSLYPMGIKYPDDYDDLLDYSQDVNEKFKMAFCRLKYPLTLSEEAKNKYIEYLKNRWKKVIPKLLENNDLETFITISEYVVSKFNIDQIIEMANRNGNTSFVAYLIDFKNTKLRIDPYKIKPITLKPVKVPKNLEPK